MSEEKLYVIYKHTSPSGKSYIGQTCNYDKRCYYHQYSDGCRAFYNAIQKYEWDNFTHELLVENLTIDEANVLEEYYIEHFDSITPNGYNLRSGGKNHKCSEETRQIMSENTKGENNPNFGKDVTIETREKLRNAQLGKKASDETKRKLSEMRTGENHWSFNRPFSEEHKQKIRDNHARLSGEDNPLYGIPLSEEQKEKISIKNSKMWIITFPNGKEEIVLGLNKFCKIYNLTSSNMRFVAKGGGETHKGFKCRHYIEPLIEPHIE